MNDEVQNLQEKFLKAPHSWEFIDIDSETLENMRADIQEVKDEIQRILYFSTLIQIKAQWIDENNVIQIPQDTLLSNETLFWMRNDLEVFTRQNILLELLYEILDENDDDIFNTMLEKYDLWGTQELVNYIQDKNLITRITQNWALKFIIAQVICAIDLYDAIEMTLREYGIDIKNSKVTENIKYPACIMEFIEEFNGLILSKMWVYSTLMN